MSTYKLTYFHAEARAEIARLIFSAAGQKFEDVRLHELTEHDYAKSVTMDEEDLVRTDEWAALKKTVPFGQLPVLEVDGQVIWQSKVIHTFLARRFGFAGKNDLEDAKAAAVAESAQDFLMEPMYVMLLEKDKAKQVRDLEKYKTETLPNGLAELEKLAGDNGYFVGDQLSYADMAVWCHTNWPMRFFKIEIDWTKYPKLKAVADHVLANPGIAKWVKNRGESYM